MAEQPILFLDVDGVISVFGFDAAVADAGDLYLVDGLPHHIPAAMSKRVLQVLPAFEAVWATGWGVRANDHLVHMLGMPGELEVVDFATRPSTDGSGHWKLVELTARAAGRAAAWIDDGHNEECRSWAEGRDEPTLLVSTEPNVGMTDRHVEELLAFSEELSRSAFGGTR